ncbi:tetratricopeptide repeat-containing protein [Vibrio parahaemolyticus]|nr:hypothetical protein [Vibrio parahaemolyticus]
MHAFIVRPFGTKTSLSGKSIDFERVEEKLIIPALKKVKVTGYTTEAFLKAGNIRADMFEQLLKADLVVADLSIHNANVFYELGIRHALRDKRTYLIRCDGDKIPFDLSTDRYLIYDSDDPEAKVQDLTKGMKATLVSSQQDSPIYHMMPSMKPVDWSQYLVIPGDFIETVDEALHDGEIGNLTMLVREVHGFQWEVEGLRLIGRALFKLKAFESACDVWEKVVVRKEGDLEAYRKLSTIYQRTDRLTKSDQAISLVLSDPGLTNSEKAEFYALRGSNKKTRWLKEWEGLCDHNSVEINEINQRREKALSSPYLKHSYEDYARGFEEDLNHFFSGLNALSLLLIKTELAAALPDTWAANFDSDNEAKHHLDALQQSLVRQSSVVEASIKATLNKCSLADERNLWAEISLADYLCLTSNKTSRVAQAYSDALADAGEFNFDAMRRQLNIFRRLGLLNDNVIAALEKLDDVESTKSKINSYERVILFTGHMIDKPGRPAARFPAEQEMVARAAIKNAVLEEVANVNGEVIGIAGGACGGDILFHEVCIDLSISSHLYLALPYNKFVVTSVQHAGRNWVDRFNTLCETLPQKILSNSKELPRWLQSKPGYSIWSRNNQWILHNALAYGADKVTLIALWDGNEGDGLGGTKDMIQQAQKQGVKFIPLNTRNLFSKS